MEKTNGQQAPSAEVNKKKTGPLAQVQVKQQGYKSGQQVRKRIRQRKAFRLMRRRSMKSKKTKGSKPTMVYYRLNTKILQKPKPAQTPNNQDGPSTSCATQPSLVMKQGPLESPEKSPVVQTPGNGQ